MANNSVNVENFSANHEEIYYNYIKAKLVLWYVAQIHILKMWTIVLVFEQLKNI